VNLEELRQRIDKTDVELLDLLAKRADLVHEVGLIKKRDGLQIYAPEREEALLRRLVDRNKSRLPDTAIRAIYREIMSAALALEEDLRIARSATPRCRTSPKCSTMSPAARPTSAWCRSRIPPRVRSPTRSTCSSIRRCASAHRFCCGSKTA
jgi:chorismate mutase-like protein